MPATASAIASTARPPSRSRSSSHDSSATTAGSVDRITPAALAVVRATPLSIAIENRKLPKNDIRNSCRCSLRVSGGSSRAGRVHGIIATAAIAKRSSASTSTGNTASSGLDKAT